MASIDFTDPVWSLPALSIRQPSAWLVVAGIKDVENRSWPTNYRGPLLIHAANDRKSCRPDKLYGTAQRFHVTLPDRFEFGGIIGVASVADCIKGHPSQWASSRHFNWLMTDARPLRFRPCKGTLGLFQPDYDSRVGQGDRKERAPEQTSLFDDIP